MQCDNLFCVYWKDRQCMLREIKLDIMGCCENCIYVNVDEKTLQTARNDFLKRVIKNRKS